MDMIGGLLFCVTALVELFSKESNPYIFIGSAIGVGLCAIVAAIHTLRR